MRMTEDQLAVQRLDHIEHIERAQLFLHLRMEHNLQHKVAELLLHMLGVVLVDRLQHLVRLLDQVLAK
ncbi:hypothetical protein D3C81_2171180 [compost metagenome]